MRMANARLRTAQPGNSAAQVLHLQIASHLQSPSRKYHHIVMTLARAGQLQFCFSLQATLWAVIGTWISNEVLLWQLEAASAADDAPAATPSGLLPALRLPSGTPRSLLVQQVVPGGRAFLFAGSSSGEVVFCPLCSSASGLSLGATYLLSVVVLCRRWERVVASSACDGPAGAGRVVQAGLAEVCLVDLACGVLAVSDQSLLLRHNTHSSSADGGACVSDVDMCPGRRSETRSCFLYRS